MKGIILLNGEPYKKKIDDSLAFVICADGAYNWAKGKVRIEENLGDFVPRRVPRLSAKVFPAEKILTTGRSL